MCGCVYMGICESHQLYIFWVEVSEEKNKSLVKWLYVSCLPSFLVFSFVDLIGDLNNNKKKKNIQKYKIYTK